MARHPTTPHPDVLLRGRRNIAIDLKHPDGVATLLDLVASADALIEGFRPRRDGAARHRARRVPRAQPAAGVRADDRLGPGRARTPRRPATTSTTSRWPARWPTSAGRARRRCRRSTWSATSAAAGCSSPSAWCARCSRRSAAARVRSSTRRWSTASAVLMSDVLGDAAASALFDENAPRHEPARHRRALLRRLPVRRRRVHLDRLDRAAVLRRAAAADRARPTTPSSPSRWTRSAWPQLKERLAEVFATKTRDEWCAIMEHTDVCFAPVLTMSEAAEHPHNVARGTFVEVGGAPQPAPAPRFSRTVPEVDEPPAHAGPAPARDAAPTGACRPSGDRRRRSPAERRRVTRVADGDARLLPRPPRRRVDQHRRHDRPGQRRGAPGGARRRHQRRVRRGRPTTSPTARRWSTAGGPRPSASAAALGVHRVVWLGYSDSGMTGWEQNADPASFLQAAVDEAAERLAAVLREEHADVLTVYDWHGNYGHPDHIKVHHVGHRAAELAGTPTVFEATMNRDHIVPDDRGRPREAGAPIGRATTTSIPNGAGRRRQPVRDAPRPRSRSPSTSRRTVERQARVTACPPQPGHRHRASSWRCPTRSSPARSAPSGSSRRAPSPALRPGLVVRGDPPVPRSPRPGAAGWDTDPDPGLDEIGRGQAAAVAERLAPSARLPVVTSPLLRCRQTAAAMATVWNVEPRVEPAVGEIPSPEGVRDGGANRRGCARRCAARGPSSGPTYVAYRDTVVSTLRRASPAIPSSSATSWRSTPRSASATGDDRLVIRRLDNCSVTVVDVVDGVLQLVESGHEADTLDQVTATTVCQTSAREVHPSSSGDPARHLGRRL